MKKLVNTRQIIFILLTSLVTLKVIYLPTLIAKDLGRDCYIFVLFMMLLDYLVLIAFIIMQNRNPNLSFYEILQKSLGTVIAKIIMFLFFAFFMLKCWAIFQSNYAYLNENLYTALSWLVFSLPVLFVVFFISKLGVNSFARLVEFCVPIIIIGFFVSLISGCVSSDYSNLLPVCENGFFSQLPKILRYAMWFGDYTIFIVFFGNIKQEKKQNLKILLSMGISIVLVAFFLATTYGVFNYSTVCHSNAISDLLQTLPSPNDIGSFDWALVLIWDIALFISFTLNALGAFYCFRQTFFRKNQSLALIIILGLVLIANVLNCFDVYSSIVFTKDYLVYFCLPVQYLLVIIVFAFSFKIKKEAKNVQISLEK